MAALRSETLDRAREIARLAGVPIEQVFAYFSFIGRIPLDVQIRISAASVAVFGLGRDRRTRKRRLKLMTYSDFWLEHESQGYLAALHAAA